MNHLNELNQMNIMNGQQILSNDYCYNSNPPSQQLNDHTTHFNVPTNLPYVCTSNNNSNLNNGDLSPMYDNGLSNDQLLIDKINDMQIKCLNSYDNLPKSVRDTLRLINLQENNQSNQYGHLNFNNQQLNNQQYNNQQYNNHLFNNQPFDNQARFHQNFNRRPNQPNFRCRRNFFNPNQMNQQPFNRPNNNFGNYQNNHPPVRPSDQPSFEMFNRAQRFRPNFDQQNTSAQIDKNGDKNNFFKSTNFPKCLKEPSELSDISYQLEECMKQLRELKKEVTEYLGLKVKTDSPSIEYVRNLDLAYEKPATIEDIMKLSNEQFELIDKWLTDNKAFFDEVGGCSMTSINQIKLWNCQAQIVECYYGRNTCAIDKIEKKDYFKPNLDCIVPYQIDQGLVILLEQLITFLKGARVSIQNLSINFLDDDKKLTSEKLKQYLESERD